MSLSTRSPATAPYSCPSLSVTALMTSSPSLPPLASIVVMIVLHLNSHSLVKAHEQTPTLGCDSEDELLANLRFVYTACSQAGESFAEVDTLVPSTITTRGCAETVRRVARDCQGLLLRSPAWFAGRKRALDAAVASAAAIPNNVDEMFHIADPNINTIHTCGAVLDDGLTLFPSSAAGQSAVAIDVGPSRGSLRLDFEVLTLDSQANDNLRLYSDEDRYDELRTIYHDDLPLTDPIDIPGGAVYLLLVSDSASRRTSFRLTVQCVCEDSPSFIDADGDDCRAYASPSAKHAVCGDLLKGDDVIRAECPSACGACARTLCATSPCLNGGTCTEREPTGEGHRRVQGETGCSDVSARSDAVNAECCNEPSEDCSSGAPATCNSGCAALLVPYAEDCSTALRQSDGGKALVKAIQDTVALCEVTARGYRCTCTPEWMGESCGIAAPPPPPVAMWHWSNSYVGITISEQGSVATMTSNDGCCYGAVISAPFFPASSDAYVEFTLTGDAAASVMVGLATSDFDPTTRIANAGYFYGAYGSAVGWMMEVASGAFYHDYVHSQTSTPWVRMNEPWTNADEPWGPTTLAAAPSTRAAHPGDTIGMWLHAGSLTVYLDGALVGVLCEGLVGNFVWAADLGDNAGGPLPEGVRISSGEPPKEGRRV
eukprot:COSAG02_NODE_3479_length_6673_cov_3.496197_1_plen_657_part_00